MFLRFALEVAIPFSVGLSNGSTTIDPINKLPENDLVIHIRSGDLFSSNPGK